MRVGSVVLTLVNSFVFIGGVFPWCCSIEFSDGSPPRFFGGNLLAGQGGFANRPPISFGVVDGSWRGGA